jgi:DNA-binding Lrp family transcriptional regulator
MPLAEVARDVGMKTTNVQRIIQGLIARGVLVGRTAQIDVTRLGFREMGLALRVMIEGEKRRDDFVAHLRKQPEISWIAEVGGGYDYMFNIIGTRANDVLSTVKRLSTLSGCSIVRKNVCERVERIRYGRGVLRPRLPRKPRFRMGSSDESVSIDEVDRKILVALSKIEFESYRELALKSGIPVPTFMRRLSALREQGVFHGLLWRPSLWAFGVQQFRILIGIRGLSNQLDRLMHEFALENTAIKLLTTSIGAWDYEFEIDVWKTAEVRELTSNLYRAFGQNIDDVQVLPILAHRKYISFPTF